MRDPSWRSSRWWTTCPSSHRSTPSVRARRAGGTAGGRRPGSDSTCVRPDAVEKVDRDRAHLGDAASSACRPKLARVVGLAARQNAVRCTSEGGRVVVKAAVEVTASCSACRTAYRVTPPTAAASVRRVLARRSARSSRGSGLGLTLAQRIVEALGGRLEASSSPGEGLAFDVSLPGFDVPLVAVIASKLAPRSPSPVGRRRLRAAPLSDATGQLLET